LAGVQELTAITSHLPGKFEFVYAPKVQAGFAAESAHFMNFGTPSKALGCLESSPELGGDLVAISDTVKMATIKLSDVLTRRFSTLHLHTLPSPFVEYSPALSLCN